MQPAVSTTDAIRHFQYRPEVVPEWCRFAHIRCGASDSLVRSWCRQLFEADEVEECSSPAEPLPGLPKGMRECTDCFVAANFPGVAGPVRTGGMIPGRIDTPREMASAMLVLQQDLADEARRVPFGEVDAERLGRLAAETERFAGALRRLGWLAVGQR